MGRQGGVLGQGCGEDCYDSDRPTVRGALSGNGRHVAYCANLKVPTRGDLYIKDMRTKALKVMTGGCPMSGEEWNPDKKRLPYQIDISETGRVIMIKVSHEPGLVRGVFDRQTGTTTDLTPALDALGLPRLDPFIPADGVQRARQYETLISGDGRIAFFGDWNGWYKVPMPG